MKTMVLVAMLLVVSQARAGITGNELLGWCEDDSAECLAYIAGANDMLNVLISTHFIPQKWCASGVTLGQIGDAVVTYLRAHPSDLHETASGFVPNALALGFPCK